MKKISITRRGPAFWLKGVVCWWLLAPGLASSAGADDDSAADRFTQMDAATEQVLNEVAELGAEMAMLEEARELSLETQLLLVVSVDPSPFFQLEAVQLQIDGQVAVFHQYAEKELLALQNGGSHRLFWESVPAGRHQLTVTMMGRVPKDPDFQRESSMTIVSGAGRRVIELQIASGKSQPFPEVSLKEWK